MIKYRNKYRVESTRLQKWDYGWNASYHITICTFRRICYFGKIESGIMHLNETGKIAEKLWHEIPDHFPHVHLSAFIVMPNHIHGIIIINKPWKLVDNITDEFSDDTVETRHALSLQQNPQQQNPNQQQNPQQQNPNQQQNPQQQLSSRSKNPGQKRFQNQGANTISSIIGGYKSAVSRNTHNMGIGFSWQNRFWDHLIQNEHEFVRIKNYIIDNPANWHEDDLFLKYPC